MVAWDQGDLASARALYEESLAIWHQSGNRNGIATSLYNLGMVAHGQDDYLAAGALYQESLAIRRALGDRGAITYPLEGLAAVAAALGSSLRAVTIWGAMERLRTEVGSPLPPVERSRYDRRVAAARAAIGDNDAFEHAWQAGRGLTLEQAIQLALEQKLEG